jgi:CheY-like chemotaxis protein
VAKVLIQEPYPEISELISRVVSRMGHETISADEARQDPDSVDVIVLDPIMLRGVDLTRLLRELDPDLPVVIESVDPLAPEHQDLRPVSHLLKPFRLTALRQAIELALEGVPAPA